MLNLLNLTVYIPSYLSNEAGCIHSVVGSTGGGDLFATGGIGGAVAPGGMPARC